MSEFYSVELPQSLINTIKESVSVLSEKAKADVNNKFLPEKYDLHMTFIYFGKLIKDPLIIKCVPSIEKLIKDVTFESEFVYDNIDLFGRFVVLKYILTDSSILLIKENLINNISELLSLNGVDKDAVALFAKNNYYDLLNKRFTRQWNPHITIGSIRTPSQDYCTRNRLSVTECIAGSYKNSEYNIQKSLDTKNLSFVSNKLV